MTDLVYTGYLSTPTPVTPRGDFIVTHHDITTEDGLRAALNEIQTVRPFVPFTHPRSPITSFGDWVAMIRDASSDIDCTDWTGMFLLSAWKQGIEAREWWLYEPDWPPGQAHSIVEFKNPRTGRWQLVDAQSAIIFFDDHHQPLDMAELLHRWSDPARRREVVIDYGPFRDTMFAHGRGIPFEDYLARGFLGQAVLNLRPPTFLATPKRDDFIIGWVFYGPGSRNDPRVLYTKLELLALLITLVLLASQALPCRSRKVNDSP